MKTMEIWTENLHFKRGIDRITSKHSFIIVPEFLWMFFSPGVKIQRNLSVQSDSKVIVHDAFFRETLTANKISIRHTISTRLKVVY